MGTSKHLDRPDVSIRTVVHYVHSSPVNGTHVTRVIKNSLTQNVRKKKCIVPLILLCHTLATSLTSRVTRCCKLGPLCPLHTLCTEQSQTKRDSGSLSTHGPQWLRTLDFLLGTRAQTQCGQLRRGRAIPLQTLFQMNPNEKVFTEKVLLLLIKYVRHFRAARKNVQKTWHSQTHSNTHTHTQTWWGGDKK